LAAGALVALSAPQLERRPLWLDEAYSVGATHDLLAAWRGTGGTMGLYYLVLWPVTRYSTDRFWVRLPSLVFAVAAVLVVHRIGRRLGDGRTAATAAGTLALMWAITRYAIEARSYTLALLLVSLSWLGLIGAVQARAEGATSSQRRWWGLFVVATLLAPLAHGLAALHFVTQVVLLAFLPGRLRWWRACIPVAVGLAAEGALLFGIGAGEVASWIPPLNERQVRAILDVLLGRGVLAWVVGALALVGALLAVRTACRRGDGAGARLALVPLVWAIGLPLLIMAISLFRPYAAGRYAISAVPGVALLVGSVVGRLRSVAFAAVAAMLALLLLANRPITSATHPEDWAGMANVIADVGDDGDRVLIRSSLRSPFDYAWSELPDDERPKLVPLSPTEPLGEVRRFYDPPPGYLHDPMVIDFTAPVWWVERGHGRLPAVVALITGRSIQQRYVVTGEWEFVGDLYLIRFEPRRPWLAVAQALAERLAPADRTRLAVVERIVGGPAVERRYEETGRWAVDGELHPPGPPRVLHALEPTRVRR
jgi:mannosyltransferase